MLLDPLLCRHYYCEALWFNNTTSGLKAQYVKGRRNRAHDPEGVEAACA